MRFAKFATSLEQSQDKVVIAACLVIADYHVIADLYGCLPDSKQNLRYFVKKSVASLYSALFVGWSGYPDFALAPMHIR